MKVIKFKHANTEYAKDQPEYNTMPVLKLDSPKGEVISCWRLSFKERLRVLIFGNVWLSLMTFNKPLTPSYMSTKRTDVYSHTDDQMLWWKKAINTIKKL